MNTNIINLDQLVSMTSVEIAELTGKRHNHVLRDIRNMVKGLNGPKFRLVDEETYKDAKGLNGPSFGGVDEETYKDAKGESRTMYRLDLKHTFILVAGYSAQLRAKYYDYIQMLEREVLELQAQQLQVAQTKAICYAPGAIVLDSKLDLKEENFLLLDTGASGRKASYTIHIFGQDITSQDGLFRLDEIRRVGIQI
ncbi:Rha family transcriptional regulator, partial [Escherichia coli]|nr:Rha family transcriptional regulator [Escherichia coli]